MATKGSNFLLEVFITLRKFLLTVAAMMNSVMCKLGSLTVNCITSVRNSAGRWYPIAQVVPRFTSSTRHCSTAMENGKKSFDVTMPDSSPSLSRDHVESDLGLVKENAFPTFAKLRGPGHKVFSLIPYKEGEMLADYVLFEESMLKSKVSYLKYKAMTRDEKNVYMAHLKAIQLRKLSYECPLTKKSHKTVSQLLYQGECCGQGCRHCPYELDYCDDKIKSDEMSIHRKRPPTMGIHRRTRLVTVDNSTLGKEANLSGKLAYCIHVYKHGYRKKHMPHAKLGDKILVAVRGEMKKAIVVGANTHFHYRSHGVPSCDTNNIVLLDDDGNPLGTRIIAPIPSALLKKRGDVGVAKILTLATKFF
uniref:Large ribosomal subunit protein uL14m n=1 Tax=Ditylenchus dipsaci TaxID=166011 RepID=A0A915DPZ4_9BILA